MNRIILHWTAGGYIPTSYEKECYHFLIDTLGKIHKGMALGGDHNAAGHFDIVVHNPTIITGESVLMKDGESCAWF